MMYANVVPIRRMPSEHPWLTYRVPAGLEVTSGSLVTIPLRGRPILGVVWSTTDTIPTVPHIQDIRELVLPSPLMTPWQLRVCDAMATTGAVSLGDVLYSILPKLSIAKYKTYFSDVPRSTSPETSGPKTINWYRQRSEAITCIVDWAQQRAARPRVILTPTKDDIDRLLHVLEQRGLRADTVHAAIAPTAVAKLMARVRAGEPVLIIGTLKALTLPFPNNPEVLLDQEEHHAHKQTSQHPRYDTRHIVRALQLAVTKTTPAPSLLTYRDEHPPLPAPVAHRRLASLDRPGVFSWITAETESAIDTALSEHQRVVIIAPRRGFASTTNCRACGYTLLCPTCGERASLFRGTHDQASCRHCHTTFSVQMNCVRCGSTDWVFHGLGIEQVVSLMQQRWPTLTVAPVLHPEVTADIIVDSYLAYHQLHTIPTLGAVIVLSGDSLINLPDFSTAERAWQYLARLQAEVPTCPILVQTFSPENVFWQRWLHADDRAWYESELAQRHRLSLPPFTHQWVARFRGSPEVVERVVDRLHREYAETIQVEKLPVTPGKAHRLLLTFTTEDIIERFPWVELFPTPWQLDRSPASWLD